MIPKVEEEEEEEEEKLTCGQRINPKAIYQRRKARKLKEKKEQQGLIYIYIYRCN